MKLTFEQVHASLGGTEILHGASVTAEEGQVTCILGPNGCGKSTLIKTLFGIVPMTEGRITLNGTDAAQLSRKEIAERVGYVGQDIPCVFDFSVREVVEMALYPRKGMDRKTRAEAVSNALSQLGIEAFADRSILSLSGGERKMVFLARALAQGVDTIILDEPTNHLDIRHQLFILDLLKRSGKTILIVLHDLRLAAHYCDKLYLLSAGRNLAEGSPLDVLTCEHVQEAYGIRGYAFCDTGASRDFRIDWAG